MNKLSMFEVLMLENQLVIMEALYSSNEVGKKQREDLYKKIGDIKIILSNNSKNTK